MTTLRVGTRASQLARTQTKLFTDELKKLNPDLVIHEVLITTHGDTTTTPLSESKVPGQFVNELREALLNKEVDFIVHSMKDLPANPHAEIETACIPKREDPRDALVARHKLADLKPNAIVGTSSPRRAAALKALRPDLIAKSIRGNVDTRITKVHNHEFDATLLAMAGLNRINRAGEVSQIFETNELVPAAAQGALSVECLKNQNLINILKTLDHEETRLTTTAERAVLRGLAAGCATAIGAFASIQGNIITLTAELAVEETGEAIRITKTGEDPESLGRAIAEELKQSPIYQKANFE